MGYTPTTGYEAEAIENWNSITREDCLALTKLPGHKPIPVLIQLASDVRNGMSWKEATTVYGCNQQTVANTLNRSLLSSYTIPAWFRAHIPGT